MKLIATNKKAYRNFFLTDKWECGISLSGGEVKSVRLGQVNFKDSFAKIEGGEVNLYSLHINPYKEASYLNDDPDRVRKLLLHKREIRKIEKTVVEKGLTLVPTKLYFTERGYVKVELCVGKGKQRFDKREAIKKRAIELALKRTIRQRQR